MEQQRTPRLLRPLRPSPWSLNVSTHTHAELVRRGVVVVVVVGALDLDLLCPLTTFPAVMVTFRAVAGAPQLLAKFRKLKCKPYYELKVRRPKYFAVFDTDPPSR